MNDDILSLLKQYYGYDRFRPLQEDIIRAVINGRDTLGLLPTGGGKSVCFQIPALALGGLTLVVTPLISLMKDQCDHLTQRGIRAAAVYLGMTQREVQHTYERVISEDYRFLYLSPERLMTARFKELLRYMDVRLLVVDEAHCISQWGYDFRPPYLKIAEVRTLLAQIREQNRHPWSNPSGMTSYHVPCLALTATATPEVVGDIQDKLRFRKGSAFFQSSFERPNLTYLVLPTEDKIGQMARLLQTDRARGASAIVYVRSRQGTADIAEELTRRGIPALFYHAGLTADEKTARQERWMAGKPATIVATNAFGMGIDKPDVRTVIHFDLPPSIEEYFQEAGRAGRDGLPAEAHLLVASSDARKLRYHLEQEYPDREYIRRIYGLLGSFFQVAIAAGLYALFEFDIYKFISAYRLSLVQVHYALHLLDYSGYIQYLEEPDRHSRLMFTTSRESLYHTSQFDNECQKIIQALLRLYTGLFADFVWIREKEICQYTGLDNQTLYDKLLLLSRFHVLHYVPARQMPAIVFLTPRLENEEIRIPHAVYEDRKRRQQIRVEAMIDYVEHNEECRLVTLLRYFGEHLTHTCGRCDVCLQQAGALSSTDAQHLTALILTTLKDKGSLAPLQLLALFPSLPPEPLMETVRTLVADHTLTLAAGILTLPDNASAPEG